LEELGYPVTEEALVQRLYRMLSYPGCGVAVACAQKQVCGLVAWSQTPLFVADKVRIRIEGLIVAQGLRGYGIGTKLMRFVEAHAQRVAPAIIDLTSGMHRGQDGTHEFYHKLGYCNHGAQAKLYLRKEIV
jgi:GNAT superfamily N-acetyltransferase